MGTHSWNEETPDNIIDAEFVPEDADLPLNKPEWRVFLYFGQAKFDAAVNCLRFVALRDGLYNYVDRRNGTPYTVPEIDTVAEHVAGTRRAAVENEEIYSKIQRVSWAVGFVAFVVGCLAVMFSGPLWSVFILLLIVGPSGLGIARSTMRHDPNPLPDHHMFYTDAEIAAEQRRKAQQEAIAMAAAAAWAAHEYQRHEQRHFAEEIAKAQDRHERNRRGMYGSQWY